MENKGNERYNLFFTAFICSFPCFVKKNVTIETLLQMRNLEFFALALPVATFFVLLLTMFFMFSTGNRY